MGWGWIKEKLMRDEDGANQEQNEFKIFYHPLDDFDINELSMKEKDMWAIRKVRKQVNGDYTK